MDAGVLYSGGKDSTLAALLLEPFCDITLLCCTFGITTDYENAMEVAEKLGFQSQRVDLDEDVALEAAEQMREDGYPRNGIQLVHEHALGAAAGLSYEGIADGTRRDDRVPTVDRSLAQQIEDRHGVSHLAPLAGIGRSAIDAFAADRLRIETGPSAEIPMGDYETELRALIAAERGSEHVDEIFPEHTQSRVVGRR